MTSQLTLAQQLAEFATRRPTASDILAQRRMRIYALDTIAVALAGTTSPSSQAVTRTIMSACGKPEATVLGCGRVTSAWDAALANGSYAHALELDDDHRRAVLHPGAVVVPAALSACEATGASGSVFLRSLLVGYEVMCRLGEVFGGRQFHHGVHPTALCGVFGSAAAAGVALGLDGSILVHAFGIAGTQASGLTEWRADGSWIKRLHPGRAAHAGVLSARLAREGFTGPATILEGDGGFFNAYSFGEPIEPECLTHGLGISYHALSTAIKPYPCCRFEHGAIDLAIDAHKSGVESADIDRVHVRIYRTGVLTYHCEPANPVDAQFNVPYGVSVALCQGNIGLSDFTEAAVRRSEMLSFARKVSVIEDDDFSARYPAEYRVDLALEMRNGETYHSASKCPSGDPESARYLARPDLLQTEVESKSLALLAECGFEARASKIASAVLSLDEAPDLNRLLTLLGAG